MIIIRTSDQMIIVKWLIYIIHKMSIPWLFSLHMFRHLYSKNFLKEIWKSKTNAFSNASTASTLRWSRWSCPTYFLILLYYWQDKIFIVLIFFILKKHYAINIVMAGNDMVAISSWMILSTCYVMILI